MTWITCGSCPEAPEANIVGDTIYLGVSNRAEGDTQAIAVHGYSAQLPASSKYTIEFEFDWQTWDSYNSPTEAGKGYWDSFSVSVTGQPYWEAALSDAVTQSKLRGLGLIWGGKDYGTGSLERSKNTKKFTVSGNPSGSNYINVVLDIRTTPNADQSYASWGWVKIKSITTSSDVQTLANAAVELAKTIAGEEYSYGGKGWSADTKKYVEAQQIRDGYYHYHCKVWDTAQNKCGQWATETAPGLDCSGLVFWTFNKAFGATTMSNGLIRFEGADGQYRGEVDLFDNEGELRPGDLLFFDNPPKDGRMDHVAMYVGGNDPRGDVPTW